MGGRQRNDSRPSFQKPSWKGVGFAFAVGSPPDIGGDRVSESGQLNSMPLVDLARRCGEETERFFRRQDHHPRYCFELFRRAIATRCERAWELAYAQYRPLVAGWVGRHSAFPGSGEEVQYFVNCAFAKMWSALTPTKFARFHDLKSLLRYLQMCVHSTILDHVRSAARTVPLEQVDWLAGQKASDNAAIEAQALDRVQRRAFWQEIDARLNTAQERRVVYDSFVLGLKPRELYARAPDLFSSVQEVYRVKENVLARLRRDSELARQFGQNA
jgi:DNA-directed RNA polymerase specialized sigma24 family protein